jgi:hypothetical protein
MYDRSYYEKNKEYLREYQRQYYYKQKLKKQNYEVVKKKIKLGDYGMMRFYYPIVIHFD